MRYAAIGSRQYGVDAGGGLLWYDGEPFENQRPMQVGALVDFRCKYVAFRQKFCFMLSFCLALTPGPLALETSVHASNYR
jgi:hypothetical protein